MALLVCFHVPGSEVDWSRRAIYLEQGLYEQLFNYCKRLESDSPLKPIVSLGYDDEAVIAGENIAGILGDLELIAASGEIRHPQIQALCGVLREAASGKLGLAVGGDMHPDLSASWSDGT